MQANNTFLVLVNRFPEFDAASDPWWLALINSSSAPLNLTKDLATNIFIRCEDSHLSIVPMPSL